MASYPTHLWNRPVAEKLYVSSPSPVSCTTSRRIKYHIAAYSDSKHLLRIIIRWDELVKERQLCRQSFKIQVRESEIIPLSSIAVYID